MTILKRKKNVKTFNDKGFTLVELVSVLAIMTVVFVGATLTISTFLLKYQELQKVSRLQTEAFRAMQVLKHGIKVNMPTEVQLMGIGNANSIEFTGNYAEGIARTGIIIKPPANSGDLSVNDEIKFYLDDGFIRYTQNVYGSSTSSNRDNYIFPDKVKRKNQDIEVTKLLFSPGNPFATTVFKIVKVELEARVELFEDKYHYVNYETYMAIGKM